LRRRFFRGPRLSTLLGETPLAAVGGSHNSSFGEVLDQIEPFVAGISCFDIRENPDEGADLTKCYCLK